MGRATIVESHGDGAYTATVELNRERLEAELEWLEAELEKMDEQLVEAEAELSSAKADLAEVTWVLGELINDYQIMTSGLTSFENARARAISEIY